MPEDDSFPRGDWTDRFVSCPRTRARLVVAGERGCLLGGAQSCKSFKAKQTYSAVTRRCIPVPSRKGRAFREPSHGCRAHAWRANMHACHLGFVFFVFFRSTQHFRWPFGSAAVPGLQGLNQDCGSQGDARVVVRCSFPCPLPRQLPSWGICLPS